jgi:hypothetical protein
MQALSTCRQGSRFAVVHTHTPERHMSIPACEGIDHLLQEGERLVDAAGLSHLSPTGVGLLGPLRARQVNLQGRPRGSLPSVRFHQPLSSANQPNQAGTAGPACKQWQLCQQASAGGVQQTG